MILNESGINLRLIIFLIIFLKIVTSKVLTVRCQDACRDSGVGCREQVLISKRGMRWIGGCRKGVGYQNYNFCHMFTVVVLLPLTQNTLPSKDVREYVFSCFLMAYRSRDLPGVILNEFGINLGPIIFLIIFLKIVTSKVSTGRCTDACRDSGVGCREQVLVSR